MSMTAYKMTLPLLKLRCRIDGKSGCWVWAQCTQDNGGYGRVRHDGKTHLAHRLAWHLSGRKLPEGRQTVLAHDCGEPRCINPAHMRLVGKGDHIRELTAAGVMSQGVKHSLAVTKHARARAKLDMEKAQQIRELFASGIPHAKIAAEFGVGQSTVQKVCSYRTWRDSSWTMLEARNGRA